MNPGLTLFNQHIEDAEFLIGTDYGSWGLLDNEYHITNWPFTIIWVSAMNKPDSPDKYYFRFNLEGYSNTAPTACPWNLSTNSALDPSEWPKGKKFVSKVFNPKWNKGALYAPCDRVAMNGHDTWKSQHPSLWWTPEFTIVNYLRFIYSLLNSSDYAKP